MKSSSKTLVVGFMLLFACGVVDVRAQETPPPLSMNLVLNNSKYLFGNPDDPIQAEITIKNIGSQPIVTSAGFSQSPFHLFLTFVGPDGKPITAAEASEGVHEGGPPRIVPVGDSYLQVEEIEVLPIGFQKIITIPDLRAFYELNKAGRYTVKGVIPIRTYATFFTFQNANFAALDAFNFSGALESGLIRLALVADADGDGYAFPEPDSRISAATVADCDDNAAAVNPGQSEIPSDGKDNDCNPATSDGAQVVAGDVNGDSTVDCSDLALVKASFGKRTGQVGFDPRADVNGDGIVNIRDLAFVSQKLPAGTTCP